MSRKGSGPLPGLVVGILTVAALGTLTANGGWVLWIPAIIALAITARIWTGLNH